MKSVYSGKSNILPTHCGLLFNPPPSPLKFTYISFKQPVSRLSDDTHMSSV